jgi:DNA-binding NarL/FixJ family response regulator
MTESRSPLPATVVVCDDRAEIRDAIRAVLSENPRFTVIGEAVDGTDCLAAVRGTAPDILILDVSMPGGGPDVARASRKIRPTMHILVYSASPDIRLRHSMLDAGADQYVVKSGRVQPLLDALELARYPRD